MKITHEHLFSFFFGMRYIGSESMVIIDAKFIVQHRNTTARRTHHGNFIRLRREFWDNVRIICILGKAIKETPIVRGFFVQHPAICILEFYIINLIPFIMLMPYNEWNWLT